ncbi:PP2C family protein-serine/threonine phosphatase [Noviherbaspirillum galbum]|uniref:Serine/threonine-protein phosphatase n=1 Tax=Noviherbaspirillum galbum TaxID=2709383 RepID=A0A6B3SQ57_9BURK|nr:protein phosphatase 2C domain-containing protein [Noviherbaspirillum galbum]NEX62781.1 serine/threonine-protein phosphatase [Noviherbaspirillum galbum]
MNTTQAGWTCSAKSHVGMVRQINEDSCLSLPAHGLWAVADGMGGHTLGDFASKTVIDALSALVDDSPAAFDSLETLVAAVRDALQAANRRLRAEAAERHAHIIGSTAVVLLIRGERCACVWAGDSRLYVLRNGELAQVTRDHSQVEELRMAGSLSDEEALLHPARNLITRAVGAADLLELDELSMPVVEGDAFLLCSDGLSNEVSPQQMTAALAADDCARATDTLIELALRNGGRDNVTVVVVRDDDRFTIEKTVLNPAL